MKVHHGLLLDDGAQACRSKDCCPRFNLRGPTVASVGPKVRDEALGPLLAAGGPKSVTAVMNPDATLRSTACGPLITTHEPAYQPPFTLAGPKS